MNGIIFSRIDASTTLLFITLILYSFIWFIFPHDISYSDPLNYSQRAFDIYKNSDFGHGIIFDHRLGIILPTALLYSIFGDNVYTSNFIGLLSSLIITIVVWVALPDNKSKLFGLLLCLTSITLFKYSTQLIPDLTASAFMSLSALALFSRRKFIDHNYGLYLLAFFATLFLVLAFLTKLSAYWITPLWVWALLFDLKSNNKNTLIRQFYIPTILFGAVFFILYLAFCNAIWGDPLARLNSVQSLTGKHLWSWDDASTMELINRLTIDPIISFVEQYGIFISLLILLGLIRTPPSIKPWSYYLLTCLFFFWYGSTSFTSYEPMPLHTRMSLPALPALYILSAVALSYLTDKFQQSHWINFKSLTLATLLITGLPYLIHFRPWHWLEKPPISAALALFENTVTQKPDTNYLLISSDIKSPRAISSYFSYQYPNNLKVISANQLTINLLKNKEVYVFINKNKSKYLKTAYNYRHYDNEINSLLLTPIYEKRYITLLMSKNNEKLSSLISQPTTQ